MVTVVTTTKMNNMTNTDFTSFMSNITEASRSHIYNQVCSLGTNIRATIIQLVCQTRVNIVPLTNQLLSKYSASSNHAEPISKISSYSRLAMRYKIHKLSNANDNDIESHDEKLKFIIKKSQSKNKSKMTNSMPQDYARTQVNNDIKENDDSTASVQLIGNLNRRHILTNPTSQIDEEHMTPNLKEVLPKDHKIKSKLKSHTAECTLEYDKYVNCNNNSENKKENRNINMQTQVEYNSNTHHSKRRSTSMSNFERNSIHRNVNDNSEKDKKHGNDRSLFSENIYGKRNDSILKNAKSKEPDVSVLRSKRLQMDLHTEVNENLPESIEKPKKCETFLENKENKLHKGTNDIQNEDTYNAKKILKRRKSFAQPIRDDISINDFTLQIKEKRSSDFMNDRAVIYEKAEFPFPEKIRKLDCNPPNMPRNDQVKSQRSGTCSTSEKDKQLHSDTILPKDNSENGNGRRTYAPAKISGRRHTCVDSNILKLQKRRSSSCWDIVPSKIPCRDNSRKSPIAELDGIKEISDTHCEQNTDKRIFDQSDNINTEYSETNSSKENICLYTQKVSSKTKNSSQAEDKNARRLLIQELFGSYISSSDDDDEYEFGSNYLNAKSQAPLFANNPQYVVFGDILKEFENKISSNANTSAIDMFDVDFVEPLVATKRKHAKDESNVREPKPSDMKVKEKVNGGVTNTERNDKNLPVIREEKPSSKTANFPKYDVQTAKVKRSSHQIHKTRDTERQHGIPLDSKSKSNKNHKTSMEHNKSKSYTNKSINDKVNIEQKNKTCSNFPKEKLMKSNSIDLGKVAIPKKTEGQIAENDVRPCKIRTRIKEPEPRYGSAKESQVHKKKHSASDDDLPAPWDYGLRYSNLSKKSLPVKIKLNNINVKKCIPPYGDHKLSLSTSNRTQSKSDGQKQTTRKDVPIINNSSSTITSTEKAIKVLAKSSLQNCNDTGTDYTIQSMISNEKPDCTKNIGNDYVKSNDMEKTGCGNVIGIKTPKFDCHLKCSAYISRDKINKTITKSTVSENCNQATEFEVIDTCKDSTEQGIVQNLADENAENAVNDSVSSPDSVSSQNMLNNDSASTVSTLDREDDLVIDLSNQDTIPTEITEDESESKHTSIINCSENTSETRVNQEIVLVEDVLEDTFEICSTVPAACQYEEVVSEDIVTDEPEYNSNPSSVSNTNVPISGNIDAEKNPETSAEAETLPLPLQNISNSNVSESASKPRVSVVLDLNLLLKGTLSELTNLNNPFTLNSSVLTSRECAEKIKNVFLLILSVHSQFLCMRQEVMNMERNQLEELQLITQFYWKRLALHIRNLYLQLISIKVIDFNINIFLEQLLVIMKNIYGDPDVDIKMMTEIWFQIIALIKGNFPGTTDKFCLWEQLLSNISISPTGPVEKSTNMKVLESFLNCVDIRPLHKKNLLSNTQDQVVDKIPISNSEIREPQVCQTSATAFEVTYSSPNCNTIENKIKKRKYQRRKSLAEPVQIPAPHSIPATEFSDIQTPTATTMNLHNLQGIIHAPPPRIINRQTNSNVTQPYAESQNILNKEHLQRIRAVNSNNGVTSNEDIAYTNKESSPQQLALSGNNHFSNNSAFPNQYVNYTSERNNSMNESLSKQTPGTSNQAFVPQLVARDHYLGHIYSTNNESLLNKQINPNQSVGQPMPNPNLIPNVNTEPHISATYHQNSGNPNQYISQTNKALPVQPVTNEPISASLHLVNKPVNYDATHQAKTNYATSEIARGMELSSIRRNQQVSNYPIPVPDNYDQSNVNRFMHNGDTTYQNKQNAETRKEVPSETLRQSFLHNQSLPQFSETFANQFHYNNALYKPNVMRINEPSQRQTSQSVPIYQSSLPYPPVTYSKQFNTNAVTITESSQPERLKHLLSNTAYLQKEAAQGNNATSLHGIYTANRNEHLNKYGTVYTNNITNPNTQIYRPIPVRTAAPSIFSNHLAQIPNSSAEVNRYNAIHNNSSVHLNKENSQVIAPTAIPLQNSSIFNNHLGLPQNIATTGYQLPTNNAELNRYEAIHNSKSVHLNKERSETTAPTAVHNTNSVLLSKESSRVPAPVAAHIQNPSLFSNQLALQQNIFTNGNQMSNNNAEVNRFEATHNSNTVHLSKESSRVNAPVAAHIQNPSLFNNQLALQQNISINAKQMPNSNADLNRFEAIHNSNSVLLSKGSSQDQAPIAAQTQNPSLFSNQLDLRQNISTNGKQIPNNNPEVNRYGPIHNSNSVLSKESSRVAAPVAAHTQNLSLFSNQLALQQNISASGSQMPNSNAELNRYNQMPNNTAEVNIYDATPNSNSVHLPKESAGVPAPVATHIQNLSILDNQLLLPQNIPTNGNQMRNNTAGFNRYEATHNSNSGHLRNESARVPAPLPAHIQNLSLLNNRLLLPQNICTRGNQIPNNNAEVNRYEAIPNSHLIYLDKESSRVTAPTAVPIQNPSVLLTQSETACTQTRNNTEQLNRYDALRNGNTNYLGQESSQLNHVATAQRRNQPPPYNQSILRPPTTPNKQHTNSTGHSNRIDTVSNNQNLISQATIVNNQTTQAATETGLTTYSHLNRRPSQETELLPNHTLHRGSITSAAYADSYQRQPHYPYSQQPPPNKRAFNYQYMRTMSADDYNAPPESLLTSNKADSRNISSTVQDWSSSQPRSNGIRSVETEIIRQEPPVNLASDKHNNQRISEATQRHYVHLPATQNNTTNSGANENRHFANGVRRSSTIHQVNNVDGAEIALSAGTEQLRENQSKTSDSRNVSRDSGLFSPGSNTGDTLCNKCLAPGNFLCSGCFSTYYCSVECQRASWERHMVYCTKK